MVNTGPMFVRRGPNECNTAQNARRASKVNTGPLSCEASQPRCCDTRSELMSLGGLWFWSEDMAWNQDVKIGTTQVALWKKAVKSSIRRMIRHGEYVPVGRSGECPEEGDLLRREDSEVAG